eukprot:TRINITY_DN1116_c4_g1_i1.p1 TRINITY_DN1116_c4_g1~~TRINITY_DN1116_c4_g1_i1.p1  ORF type:complete len:398 (+),score=111.25 TRINITY_DN1116_c4_g1_i1:3-1196(+)
MTSLGGSLPCAAAREAAAAAAGHFVDLNALLAAAGERIAALSKAPAGYTALPCTGAAAGLALCTAACAQAAFPELAPEDFPLPPPARCAVVVDGSADLRWLRNIAVCGVHVLRIGAPGAPMRLADLVKALSGAARPRVVAVMVSAAELGVAGRMGVAEVVQAAGPVPVIVDAAAMLGGAAGAAPLWEYARAGAAAVLFSGGKLLRASQSSGFVIGRRELLARAARHAAPNEAAVGRLAKTTEEDVCGLVAALEAFVERDFPADMARLRRMCEDGAAWLKGAGVRAEVEFPDPVVETDVQPNTIPRLVVCLPGGRAATAVAAAGGLDHSNPLALPDVAADVDPCAALRGALARHAPPIALGVTPTGAPSISPLCLTDAEMRRVLRAVCDWYEGVYGSA